MATDAADPEAVKARVRRDWDGNADRWRRRTRETIGNFGPVGGAMMRLAEIRPSSCVLDVASGSGEPALSIARLVEESGRVVASDQSAPMLAIAQDRARAAQLTNVRCVLADAERLGLADGAFDAVTCRFGVMFCPRPLAVLSEMRRVLRPGGRVVIAVWAGAEKNPAGAITNTALAPYRREPPPEPRPGVPHPHSWSGPGVTESLMREAGLRAVAIEPVAIMSVYDSLAHYLEVWRETNQQALKTILADRTEAEAARIRAAVEASVRAAALSYAQDGRIVFPGEALCAAACA